MNYENFETNNLESLRTALSQVLNQDLSQADRDTLVKLMVENDAFEAVVEILVGGNVYTTAPAGSLYQ